MRGADASAAPGARAAALPLPQCGRSFAALVAACGAGHAQPLHPSSSGLLEHTALMPSSVAGARDHRVLGAAAGGSMQQCGSPSATQGVCTSGDFLAAPLWRHRSSTPVEHTVQDPSSMHCEPITPAAAASQAPGTPAAAGSSGSTGAVVATTAFGGAAAAGASATAAVVCTAGDAGAAAAQHAARVAAVWRTTHAFMQCVAASPLVQSALLSLELEGSHPAPGPALPAAHAVQWTVAQLLAMHIKAGHLHASEHSVLACLWVLESADSVWRSPATVCLNDYLRHLGAFSTQAVVEITADWRNSFCCLRQGVVDAQIDVLKRLDWRVRLDAATEVAPCMHLLFHLPAEGRLGVGTGAGTSSSTRALWAAHMCHIMSNVQRQAMLLSTQARLATRLLEGCGEDAQLTPTKRRRMQA